MSLFVPVGLIIMGGGAVVIGGLTAGDERIVPSLAALRTRRKRTEARQLQVATVGAGVLGVLVGALCWPLLGLSPLIGLLCCALLGTAGALAPRARADRAERLRLQAANRGVADFAGLLSVELRSGLGLDAAMENVAFELKGVLAEEMQTVNAQVRIGMPRDRALELLRDRVPIANVERLSQTIRHAGELGAPVADSLDKLAADCTLRHYQEVREEAAKLPVKILFPVIFCVFPPMLVVLVGPAMLDIAKALG